MKGYIVNNEVIFDSNKFAKELIENEEFIQFFDSYINSIIENQEILLNATKSVIQNQKKIHKSKRKITNIEIFEIVIILLLLINFFV